MNIVDVVNFTEIMCRNIEDAANINDAYSNFYNFIDDATHFNDDGVNFVDGYAEKVVACVACIASLGHTFVIESSLC